MTVSNAPATNFYSTTAWEGIQVPRRGPGFIKYVLAALESLEKVKGMLSGIALSRRNTRPGYPPIFMWRILCMKYLLNEPYNLSIVERLKTSSDLRGICGFEDRVPSERTLGRFFTRIANEYPELSEQFVLDMTKRLARYMPTDFGRVVAIDSTDVPSFACGNLPEPIDTVAEWGKRTRKRRRRATGAEKVEDFFGRKLHVLVCAKYGIPIVSLVTPSTTSDNTTIPTLIEKAKSIYGEAFQPKVLLADRGYDGKENFEYLVRQNIEPIILIRKPTADDSLYQGLFNKDGLPVCGDGEVPMEYVRSEGASHLFKCPDGGCSLREKSAMIRHCDASEGVWFDGSKRSPESVRAFGWKVLRSSETWDELYSLRQTVERFFASIKQSRLLDKCRFLSNERIELHLNMSIATYAATMVANVAADNLKDIRIMRIRF